MADKKISEFGTFPGKQDEETYYVVASGDSSSPSATNYKVPFTDLALQVTGDLSLGMYIDEDGDVNINKSLNVSEGASISGRITLPCLGAAPSSPEEGEMYFDTGGKKFYGYNGTSWAELG